MIKHLIFSTCLLLAYGFSDAQCWAQPIHGFATSVEATVQNADRVFVGKIMEFDLKVDQDNPKTRDQNAPTVWVAKIAVTRTIKGGHKKKLKLPLTQQAAELNEWTDDSSQLLFVVRDTPETKVSTINLSDKELQMITADFSVLRTANDVIKAAETVVHRNPGVLRTDTFRLLVPNEKLANTKWETFHGTYVIVPVDRQLEQRTLKYLKSDHHFNRCEAALALRHFKSPENIALAKSLLNDEGWGYYRHPINNNGITVRHYGVRAEAYETLQYWGIEVDKPIIRESVSE